MIYARGGAAYERLCAWAAGGRSTTGTMARDSKNEILVRRETAMKIDQPHEGLVIVRGAADGFVQEVTAGAHHLRCDEPESAGGTDTGPTPYDLLLAALGACTSMTLAMYARRKKWPLSHVSVRLRHSHEYAQDSARCETQDARLTVIDREIELDGSLDDDQRARLLAIANRCPVHLTLSSRIEIRTTLQ